MTGIILAGGKSTRMGSEKGLIPFRGKPMIEYAVDVLRPFCDEILISANTSSFDYLGFDVVKDIFPHSGPMGGIYTGLTKSISDKNFVLSCDIPLIDQNTIRLLMEMAEGCDVTVPWHGDNLFEPLCAIYHKSVLPVMEQQMRAGNFKLPDMFKKINLCKIKTGTNNGINAELFFNVNSKEDLMQLEKKGIAEPDAPRAGTISTVEHLPNVLLIAGAGRNTGKTTLACAIIRQISRGNKVAAIKISPHPHRQNPQQKIIEETSRYMIIEETDKHTAKDSSRMLRAGAHRVYYLQSTDRHIRMPFNKIMEMIPSGTAVVCESGALLNEVRPGLFLMLNRKGESTVRKGIDQLPYPPDQRIVFDGKDFDADITKISFRNDKWHYE